MTQISLVPKSDRDIGALGQLAMQCEVPTHGAVVILIEETVSHSSTYSVQIRPSRIDICLLESLGNSRIVHTFQRQPLFPFTAFCDRVKGVLGT